jgi:hypothetical protein
MSQSNRAKPSPALVISLIALFVALGSGAYAASKIRTQDIRDEAVTGKKLAKNAVKSSKTKDGGLKGKDLKDETISESKIGEMAVTTPKLSDGAVTTPKIGDGAVTKEKLGPGALEPTVVARTFITNAISGTGEAEANCNAGETLIGGGGGWTNSAGTAFSLTDDVSDSSPSAGSDVPTADGASPQAWHVSGVATGTKRLLAYAICLSH